MTVTCARCEALTLAFAEFLNPRPRPRGRLNPEPADVYDFLGDETDPDPNAAETVAALHDRYLLWCEAEERRPIGKNRFGHTLGSLGFPAYRSTSGARYRRGLRLR